MPGAMSVHCFAHLDKDVGEAIPYLNAVFGGFTYVNDPPTVTFKSQGKLITVHSKKMPSTPCKTKPREKRLWNG